uniref:Uncharacterized protein n=1 Tax=Hucho hucho TaxID=62062 RepID=A0A4W5KP84_9TELE
MGNCLLSTNRSPTCPDTRSPTYPDTRSPTYPDTRSPTYPDTRSPTYPDTRSPTYPDTRSPTYPDTSEHQLWRISTTPLSLTDRNPLCLRLCYRGAAELGIKLLSLAYLCIKQLHIYMPV